MNNLANIKNPTRSIPLILHWIGLFLILSLLLVAVAMIGTGLKWSLNQQIEILFQFASNPIAGLMIGLMATALIQSSSAITSIIVGLVAGGLPVETAIPMIMGANIGTTVTNTLVSLGHAHCKEEFKQAFACATIHDFFNLLAVFIFFPLEMIFGIFEHLSQSLIEPLMKTGNIHVYHFYMIDYLVDPIISMITEPIDHFGRTVNGIIIVIFGIVTIAISVKVMGSLMRKLMIGRARDILKRAIGREPLHGIASGTLVTILVQSSSTTTSLIVPFVGTGVLKVRDVYPFTLGANIGTCVTALLAATAISGEYAIYALQIALVHLSFNVISTLVIYGSPFLRELPLKGANWVAEMLGHNKAVFFLYLAFLFILLPSFVLIFSI